MVHRVLSIDLPARREPPPNPHMQPTGGKERHAPMRPQHAVGTLWHVGSCGYGSACPQLMR